MKKILSAFSVLLFSVSVVNADDVCKEINEVQFLTCCDVSDRPTALETIFALCTVEDVHGKEHAIVAEFNRKTGKCKLVSFYYKLRICKNEK